MPYSTYFFITDECANCGACELVCPMEAISEGDEYYEIDKELCKDRPENEGPCLGACPVDAITCRS